MNQDSHMLMATMPEMSDVSKGKLDIIVLRYMARRLHLTLRQLDQPDSLRQTQSHAYKLQERGGRTHRIAIYQPEKLLAQVPLSFVGFISARQKLLCPSIIQEIQQADKRLIDELADAPGVLSYSSLELLQPPFCIRNAIKGNPAIFRMLSSAGTVL